MKTGNEIMKSFRKVVCNIRVTGCIAESSRLENNEFAVPSYFF